MPKSVQNANQKTLELIVLKSFPEEDEKYRARVGTRDLALLGAKSGDYIELIGHRRSAIRVVAIPPERETRGVIHLNKECRDNIKTNLFEKISIRLANPGIAQKVTLDFSGCPDCRPRGERLLEKLLKDRPLVVGDKIVVPGEGEGHHTFTLNAISPPLPVALIGPKTVFEIIGRGAEVMHEVKRRPHLTYQDIGGLEDELDRVREIVELPLIHPELFTHMGIDPPRGVLMHGPPGTGKTLMARIIAAETKARFLHINGPEIMNKYYGESEAALRTIFEEATREAPAIIFLDEIDAIAPKREEVHGEVEKRVVAQLLALLDGLEERGQVIVIGATNIPNVLDPALRRPGRFDREISVPIPNVTARRAILDIHSRKMPLADDVDMNELAKRTHGFVGADVAALCREAAITAIRKFMPELREIEKELEAEYLEKIKVTQEDFLEALKSVEPSAIREVFLEVPDIHWDDIGGLYDAKQHLIEAIQWPLKYPEYFEVLKTPPPKGILLTGAHGTGKTLIAQAVAKESGINFIAVKGPELISKYVGESEKGIRDVFKKARLSAPCIIFFDEIDSFATLHAIAGENEVGQRMVSQFLNEMDGIEELKGVIVLAATAHPETLDPALMRPGRFDLILNLPLPDLKAREEIFKIHLKEKPLDPELDFEKLAALAGNGFSGADIAAACQEAALAVMREGIARGVNPEQLKITMLDLTRQVEQRKKKK